MTKARWRAATADRLPFDDSPQYLCRSQKMRLPWGVKGSHSKNWPHAQRDETAPVSAFDPLDEWFDRMRRGLPSRGHGSVYAGTLPVKRAEDRPASGHSGKRFVRVRPIDD